jgi:predicted amidohydrolase YtcJ
MEKATRIFTNGSILTMDSRGSTVEALAVRGDRIFAVGGDRDIMALRGKDTEVTDLHGRALLPGFIDGHSHFVAAGKCGYSQLDLFSPPVGKIRSMGDLLRTVREKADATPKGTWITGFGYDDTLLEERHHPLAFELDQAAPDHPVFLSHVSWHLAACNGLALRLAGITRDTANPAGGCIRRNEDGSPNGVLEEPSAMGLVSRLIPPLSRQDWMKALALASATYAARGVTSAQDGCTDPEGWSMLQAAHSLEDSPLRVRVQILPGISSMEQELAGFPASRSGTQLTPDCMLSLGAVKHFADGSLQGYTGYLSNPYHPVLYDLPGGPLWRGYPIESPLELTEKVVKLHCAGWQIAIHGNGDDAIQNILDAYEEANKRYPRADARHIIIHCQTVREDQLDRISRLGVLPSFFVTHTYYWGDRHYAIFLGPDRAKRISPLRSALQRGIRFSIHNDAPVTPINPLLSVWSAVNRLTSGGAILGANQTIPVMDALRSVTIWAARQAREEHLKGSLEPGKLADMAVLESNPLTVPPQTIKDIGVAAAIVGGETIFGS